MRAVQLLPGHSKPESTPRYLDIKVDDAREISEQTETCRRQSLQCGANLHSRPEAVLEGTPSVDCFTLI